MESWAATMTCLLPTFRDVISLSQNVGD